MPFINYNGLIYLDNEPIFTIQNQAFRSGEGLIETMLWKDDNIRFFDLHVERMKYSLAGMGLPSFEKEQLTKEIFKTITANHEPETGMIRTQCFMERNNKELQFIIEYIPLDKSLTIRNNKGLTLGISEKAQKNPDNISHLKTTSRLNYSLAVKEANEKGWDDILLLNANQRIVESTICNIFMIKGSNISTPPLTEGCIAGIMRRYLLEQGDIENLSFSEKVIDKETLLAADEIFLTNAIRGVQSVTSFEGKEYNNDLTHVIFDKILEL